MVGNSIAVSHVTLGFEWDSVPKDGLVVDVAGGVGNYTMALYKKHKHLRYILEDRPDIIKEAEGVCSSSIYLTNAHGLS